VLKPQDILVALKIALLEDSKWTYLGLATSLGLGQSEVFLAVQRAMCAGLISKLNRTAMVQPLIEFLVHGLRYCFPAEFGKMSRGRPTAFGAEFVKQYLAYSDAETVPVWPSPTGSVRGVSLKPIHKAVPAACARDDALYEIMALIDMLRSGKARERRVAAEQITERLNSHARQFATS
jgi:hypothetical protein